MHDSTFVKAGFQGEKYSLTLTAIENNKNQFHTSNSKAPYPPTALPKALPYGPLLIWSCWNFSPLGISFYSSF
jgi:hypothetical protein